MKTNFLKIAVIGLFVFLASKLFPSQYPAPVKGKSIMVGDSHAVGIGSKIKNIIIDKRIAKGGWRVSNLINALNTYPISMDVSRVFISIGTNGQFNSSDNILGLIKLLRIKFPNAILYFFGGSYGWSGNEMISSIEMRFNKYYKRFTDAGVVQIKNRLGYFRTDADAHSTNSPTAQAIINEISSIIK